MPGICVIGLQWGDEGKGKISVYLSRGAKAAVRFNGGANAGHAVRLNGRELKFHIIPIGSVFADSAVIGPGTLIDLDVLIDELRKLEELRGRVDLMISERAHVVLPIHKSLDSMWEESRGARRVGTTGRGIGPAASDRYARFGVRVVDLLERETLREKLRTALAVHHLGDGERSEELYDWLVSRVPVIDSYVRDVGPYVAGVIDQGGAVVYEGAQGTMLDIDHGTYPYVTSSHTIASFVPLGVGVSPRYVSRVVGVVKAYTTRVGGGPLPTEIEGELGAIIRERGHEYGTTTGRPRRIGWLDLVGLRYAAELNGVDELALTMVDVLSGLNEVKVCVKYEVDGKTTSRYPSTVERLSRVRPVYQVLRGWKGLEGERVREVIEEGYGGLPVEARRYVEFIEEDLGVKIRLISVGPGHNEVVVK
ncbi:MAG: adenylosuccinate synthase [Aigarchaeota archaeon]|nr:adenylosuccinate synthase [Aigarchaeota archaeon]MDW8092412.1 adenylosuccinate synthase [Nitrososphaerota archaeon]